MGTDAHPVLLKLGGTWQVISVSPSASAFSRPVSSQPLDRLWKLDLPVRHGQFHHTDPSGGTVRRWYQTTTQLN